MITVIIVITTGLWINVTNDFPSLLISETFIWVYHQFTLNRLDIYALSLIIFPPRWNSPDINDFYLYDFLHDTNLFIISFQFFYNWWFRLNAPFYRPKKVERIYMSRFSQAAHHNIKSLSCVPMRWKCFYCAVGSGIKWIYQRDRRLICSRTNIKYAKNIVDA